MNYQEPLRTGSIDFNKIVYPKTKNGKNKKLILMKYDDKLKIKNFVFQTPTLLNIFNSELNSNYADIEIALVGKEKTKVDNFKVFLNELENKIKEDAQSNSSSWFNLDNDNQTINFQKIVRESETYPEGTIKLKIIRNNDFETLLQLNNNRQIGFNKIPNDSWCKLILECYGVWINKNNDFGIFFRPILISFTPKEKEVYKYQFIEDSDEDNDNDNDVDFPDTEVNHNIFMKINSVNSRQINDSTSQLEYNVLMKELGAQNNHTTELISNILNSDESKKVLDVQLNNENCSSSESSEQILDIQLNNYSSSESLSSDD
jgi:hypothetical protein